jgi:NAD(P)-dependent dehydrogenase (short-subunit alcohol dehydrogenase family)
MTYSGRRRLDGYHIVITGASGGIGRALCRRVHRDGATITAIGRHRENDGLWRDLNATFIVLDVGAPRDVIADAVSAIAPIKGLVNLAGVESVQNFPDYDDAEFTRVVNINVRGPLNLIQALRPKMQPGTSIVNVTTMDAMLVLKTMAKSSALYAASKAALAMLTQQLAAELGPDHIRVNGVAPGIVDTPATANMPASRRDWIVEHTALRRIGQPPDIGDVIAFLLGGASSFVTGQVIPVDGGMAAAVYGPSQVGGL